MYTSQEGKQIFFAFLLCFEFPPSVILLTKSPLTGSGSPKPHACSRFRRKAALSHDDCLRNLKSGNCSPHSSLSLISQFVMFLLSGLKVFFWQVDVMAHTIVCHQKKKEKNSNLGVALFWVFTLRLIGVWWVCVRERGAAVFQLQPDDDDNSWLDC